MADLLRHRLQRPARPTRLQAHQLRSGLGAGDPVSFDCGDERSQEILCPRLLIDDPLDERSRVVGARGDRAVCAPGPSCGDRPRRTNHDVEPFGGPGSERSRPI